MTLAGLTSVSIETTTVVVVVDAAIAAAVDYLITTSKQSHTRYNH
jgi:hypothetical protein